jgi:hypothetical protein
MFLPLHGRPWPVRRVREAPCAEMRSYVPLIVRRALRSAEDLSPLACWIRRMSGQVGRAGPDAIPATAEEAYQRIARWVSRRLELKRSESASAGVQDTVRA